MNRPRPNIRLKLRLKLITRTAICSLLLLPGVSTMADPCGMLPPIYLEGVVDLERIGLQKTFVFYKDGIESFVIRPGFQGSVDEFGMLIPFPNPPELRKVADDTFAHIAAAIDPPEVVIDLRPIEIERYAFGFAETDSSYIERQEDEKSLEIEEVRVLKQEAVGMYEAAVLKAGSAAALNKWMTDHGFRYPEGMDDVCNDYVAEDWCFVAVKAKVGQQDGVDPKPGMETADATLPDGTSFGGHVQGMGFRFKSDELVVPMRLSAFNKGDLDNVVYLLTDKAMKARDLPAAHVVRQVSGKKLYKNLTERLPLRIIGGEYADLSKAQRQRLKGQRDPNPHNGIARLLFASDLVSAKTGELSHEHEELEKKLLTISEKLGLRGPDIDAEHNTMLDDAREVQARTAIEDLRKMTLTVLDGDFEREVVAAENVYFTEFDMPEDQNNAQHYNAREFGPAAAGFLGANLEQAESVDAVAMIHPTAGRLILQPAASSPSVTTAQLKVIVVSMLVVLLGTLLLIWRLRRRRSTNVALTLLMACCIGPLAMADKGKSVPANQGLTRPYEGKPIVSTANMVIPLLIENMHTSTDIAKRGSAIAYLGKMGGDEIIREIQKVAKDKSQPSLIRIWAAAALIGQAKSVEDLSPYFEMRKTFAALQRPLELRVTRLLSENDISAEDLLTLCAKNPELQQSAAKLILTTKPADLASVLMTSANTDVRRQAAAWLATMKSQNVAGVNAAVIEAVKFTKAAEAPPWGDGPLFIPGVNWEKAEAIELINELSVWYLTCSKRDQSNQCSKIITNLNSRQLMSAAGFSHVPSNVTEWLTIWHGVIGGEEMDVLTQRSGYRLVPTKLTPVE